ncbi:uncharacterized protein ACRADG_010244 [Cochliomyia hominivorax]
MTRYIQVLVLIYLINPTYTWNVDYVGQKLVLPIARGTQETLFCICADCLVLKNSIIKRNIFTLIVVKSFQDYIFEIHHNLVAGRHFYINIILMLEPVLDFQLVVAIVRYLYEEKFVSTDVYYVNATTKRNEVFSYDAFPIFKVINKTHLVGDVQKFYYKIIAKTDLKGYHFKTPLMQDPPKVIRYQNKQGLTRIQGVTFNIMNMTLGYLNGTLSETKTGNSNNDIVNMKYVLQEVRERKVELGAHAYALFHNDKYVQKSYPLLVVNWCLMLPIFKTEFTMFYPLTPFQWKVWLIVWLTFVVVNFVTYEFFKLHGIDNQNFLLINFCKFINTAPPRPTQNPTKLWFDMILNGFVFVQGFILSAFYTSTLGSFLAVTVIRSQINSLPELIEAQIPIMIIDYELNFLLQAKFSLPDKFLDLIKPVDSTTFYKHQVNLNKSFGYFTTYDTWHFLNLQQKHLKPPLFHYSDICFGDYHLAFPMITESPIWRDVEYLMFRIHSSGLYFYHEKKSFEYAQRAGLLRYRNKKSSFHTVGLMHLKLVLGFWLFGLMVAFIRFLYELRHQRKLKEKKHLEVVKMESN